MNQPVTPQRMDEVADWLCDRDLDQGLPAMLLGTMAPGRGAHTTLVAWGIDRKGNQGALGLYQGPDERSRVDAMLANLRRRQFPTSQGVFVCAAGEAYDLRRAVSAGLNPLVAEVPWAEEDDDHHLAMQWLMRIGVAPRLAQLLGTRDTMYWLRDIVETTAEGDPEVWSSDDPAVSRRCIAWSLYQAQKALSGNLTFDPDALNTLFTGLAVAEQWRPTRRAS